MIIPVVSEGQAPGDQMLVARKETQRRACLAAVFPLLPACRFKTLVNGWSRPIGVVRLPHHLPFGKLTDSSQTSYSRFSVRLIQRFHPLEHYFKRMPVRCQPSFLIPRSPKQ